MFLCIGRCQTKCAMDGAKQVGQECSYIACMKETTIIQCSNLSKDVTLGCGKCFFRSRIISQIDHLQLVNGCSYPSWYG